jgi:hypothetical protein
MSVGFDASFLIALLDPAVKGAGSVSPPEQQQGELSLRIAPDDEDAAGGPPPGAEP